MASGLAAIDVQRFACDEVGALEVKDRVDDIGDLAQPADRVQGRQQGVCFRLVHGRADNARRDRVHANAAAREFDGERSGHSVKPALGQRGQGRGHLRIGVVDQTGRDVDE